MRILHINSLAHIYLSTDILAWNYWTQGQDQILFGTKNCERVFLLVAASSNIFELFFIGQNSTKQQEGLSHTFKD